MNLIYNFQASDAARPSFFEMYLESQMMPSLKPAVDFIVSVLANRSARLASLLPYTDEMFYLTSLVLESHFLKHYDGSFSENFYGLKREIVTRDGKKGPPLQRRQKLMSLFFLVGLPYIRSRLENHIGPDAPRPTTEEPAWKKHLRSIYKVVASTHQALRFAYQLLYMYNYTQYFTPELHLQRLTVTRLTTADFLRQTRRLGQEVKERLRNSETEGLMRSFLYSLKDTLKALLDASKYVLPLSIFVFQFLQWWYHEPRLESGAQVALPPPPDPPTKANTGLALPADKSLCAICQRPRTNPAAATSGFVFCYPCLKRVVEEENRCPVTHIPMRVDQIRRIFDDQMV